MCCCCLCVQVRRAAATQNGTSSTRQQPNGNGSKGGSPTTTTSEDDTSPSPLKSFSAPSILPSTQLLPSVGATGVRLLQQLSGQGGQQQQQQPALQQQQPQQVEGVGKAGADSSAESGSGPDLGGTAVTAERAELVGRASSPTALKNGTKK